jgi:tRNA threonylcarbamoyladenosine biosynthesis protein TsaE
VTALVSDAPATTRAIGAALAGLLAPGDLVVLGGDLGAGKTELAKGVAAGLGVDEPVVSPTFTIVRTYEGRARLHHLDVYRLDRVQEALDLALDELLEDGVVLVEWGAGIASILPADRIEVTLALGDPDEPDDRRRLTVSVLGDRWAGLPAALAPWSVPEPSC